MYRGDAELESLRICLPIVGERGSLAQGLKDADIVSLYKNKNTPPQKNNNKHTYTKNKKNNNKKQTNKQKKNKGEKSDCSNYRGILLFPIAGKILGRVLLNRLIPTITQENTPESQCGFRSNSGTVDMVIVLRQILEKCREQNMGLYAAFVDLTKVFDTVSRI